MCCKKKKQEFSIAQRPKLYSYEGTHIVPLSRFFNRLDFYLTVDVSDIMNNIIRSPHKRTANRFKYDFGPLAPLNPPYTVFEHNHDNIGRPPDTKQTSQNAHIMGENYPEKKKQLL